MIKINRKSHKELAEMLNQAEEISYDAETEIRGDNRISKDTMARLKDIYRKISASRKYFPSFARVEVQEYSSYLSGLLANK